MPPKTATARKRAPRPITLTFRWITTQPIPELGLTAGQPYVLRYQAGQRTLTAPGHDNRQLTPARLKELCESGALKEIGKGISPQRFTAFANQHIALMFPDTDPTLLPHL